MKCAVIRCVDASDNFARNADKGNFNISSFLLRCYC